MNKRIYLDNAASTPLSEEVLLTMNECMRELFGNPSSIHADGRRAKAKVEEARKQIAGCIGASIGEIFFTSGGTESNNMAIRCAVRDLGVRRIISTKTEHPGVFRSIELAEKQGSDIQWLKVDHLGRPDYNQLEDLLRYNPDTKTLVSIMHANNETGTLTDMEHIAGLCQTSRAYFHSDTVQTIGHFPIDVSKTNIHFLAGSAHKFHGPKGCGFIYIRNDAMLQPFIVGGSQERNMRAGTENIYGIAGMAKALELACENMEKRRAYIEDLRSYFKNQLLERFEDIQFNGDQENYLYTILNVSFPPSEKSPMLLLHLDIAGISASGGSACSSGAESHSHVLQAIEADPDRKAIRFSFSHYNSKKEIDIVLNKLSEIVKEKKVIPVWKNGD
ncbi:MAG TPA: cysteine desulfurase [Bacteroidetes bacterium]|nr:cysteine desulfurase [Bacteroidota bacterium]